MGGVDKGDQLHQYYHIRTKCMKNYKYLFCFGIDVAITNSFILSLFTPTSMSLSQQRLKAFQLQLAQQLVGEYNSWKQLGRPRVLTTAPHHPPLQHGEPNLQHSLSHLEKKRRCVYCTHCRDPPKRRNVMWSCGQCDGEPALCLTGLEDGSGSGTHKTCNTL